MISFSAPGGDFQSVLDDDMVPFEQVKIFVFSSVGRNRIARVNLKCNPEEIS